MRKKIIIGLIGLAVVVSGFLFFNRRDDRKSSEITVQVAQGKFIIDITTTGELEARNSIEILGPSKLRDFRIFNLTIQDIVEEGKVVQQGDWIASLDKSEFQSRLQDKEIDLERYRSQFVQTQLDTTLQMRQARDELINLEYAVEERKISLEQSQFEPPATIKQAEFDLDKAIRAYEQAKQNYSIRLEQNRAKMSEVSAELRKAQREYNDMTGLIESFDIRAPESGMVIYAKGWDQKPLKAGSQISTWRPVVATLPDLRYMISKTYINEVDVRRVKPGQEAEIGLDAFPEKKLTGTVVRVANVGEQRQNSDSKVFETTIEIDGSDDMLRPSMTTSNRIIVDEIDSVLFVPLECLHNQYDSITYVFKKTGVNISKQEVEIGPSNSNEVVVLNGLKPGDRVFLSLPAGQEEKTIALLPEMDGKRIKKEEPVQEEAAATSTITLPDGTTRTVTEEDRKRFEQMRQQRQQNGTGQAPARRPNS
jgi:HlyD family secretion protein